MSGVCEKAFPVLHQEESGSLGIFSQVENLCKDTDSRFKSVRYNVYSLILYP